MEVSALSAERAWYRDHVIDDYESIIGCSEGRPRELLLKEAVLIQASVATNSRIAPNEILQSPECWP